MRTFPLNIVPPSAPGFDVTLDINDAPPGVPAPPPAAGCACADLAAVWYFGSSDDLTVEPDTDPPPTFAITGSICPGTVFTPAVSWSGFGESPVVQTFGEGSAAFAVYSINPGVAAITVTADCGGVTSTLNTLNVIFGTGDCVAPEEYTNILTLIDACPAMLVQPLGPNSADYYTWDDDVFTVHWDNPFPQIPNYDGTGPTPVGVYLTFFQLEQLFLDTSMDVRFTLVDNSIPDDAHGQNFDNETGALADFPSGTVIERTIAAEDVAAYFTGAGVGDGAGNTGSCVFRIEVRKTPV